jgi:hypothetical protein
MRNSRNLAHAAYTTLGLIGAGAVSAADNCSGYTVNAGGRNIAITQTSDPAQPWHVMVGACDMEGRCVRKDRDGDVTISENAYVPGKETASWKTIGGTGKYVDGAGSGWYKLVRADGDAFVFVWGGDCSATTKRAGVVPLTKDQLRSTFTNAVVMGMCTDGAAFENRYGASGAVAHTTSAIGGQILFSDDKARWSPRDDADGASLCFSWSSGGTSCWKNYKIADLYVGREQGGQDRICWFNVTPQ